MFVGHGALAFAIVALAAHAAGFDRQRTLSLGILAGAFATLPDIDMVYALAGLGTVPTGGSTSLVESFWSASTVVHRSMTHSLVLALPATVTFALIGRSGRGTAASVLLGTGIVATAAIASGPLMAAIAIAFVVAGLLIGWYAGRSGLGGWSVGIAAMVGLATHPFGDVLTGQPPELLYPLAVEVFDGRVWLSADPTVHLLGAFGVELAAIWLGVLAFVHLRETNPWTFLRPRAALGASYAFAVLFLPVPTVDWAYPFVFSVLAVGMVGVLPVRKRLPGGMTAVTTGLAGVSVAAVAYTLAYLLLDAAPLLAQASQAF
ncbi:MAG: metal-dependent hydrolase [Halanaeroarchaeum sp.]